MHRGPNQVIHGHQIKQTNKKSGGRRFSLDEYHLLFLFEDSETLAGLSVSGKARGAV